MDTKKNRLRLTAGFALLLILFCSVVMSGILAKYRTETVIANEVDYTNQLADSFSLLDKPMRQLEDGSYEVDADSSALPTDGYTFKLIPGVTIPAEPYVEIKGKTEIPAYLFLETDNSSSVILTFDGKWTKLDGVSGKKGGDVYAYDNGSALIGGGSAETLTIPTFTVEPLSKYPAELSEGTIRVYAYLMQRVGDKSAADTYREAPAV